ncbi:hypothetical protein D9615_009791 [Tricholomella constricta]|uniref:Hemerythrin-like domain-containing protein n=1 Tax=Tricholomella constricta TaxID=117010 RepID=A0A8H5LUX9_9AGAR|nr:hypothetical protein D9615_009791 [Tricholomella constricta]
MQSKPLTRISSSILIRSIQQSSRVSVGCRRALFFTAAIPFPKTLTEAITEDHREMYDFYRQYIYASGDKGAQEHWARLLTWEIARHAVGEEIVVHPLVELCLGEQGAELTEQGRMDHQFVKEILYRLEPMTPGSLEYAALLRQIMDHLHKHNEKEEKEDLPLIEPILGSDRSLAAAFNFLATKKFAPSRANPAPSDWQPPFETLVDLLKAPLDKLNEAYAKFSPEGTKGNAKLS